MIDGRVRGMLSSFLNTDPDNPTGDIVGSLDSVAENLNEKLFGKDSDHPIARSSQDLAATMRNLTATTAQLQSLMAANSRSITTTMNNLATLTNSLADRQESLGGLIDNTETFTNKLSAIEIDKTLAEANETLSSLRGTLGRTNEVMGGVNGLVSNLTEGNGTLGKLLNDEAIYDRLDRATRSMDTLVTDLQERPYRYIPFKSRRRVLKFDKKDAERSDEVNAISGGK
jgi:phospholipid/cholesterol/gamma-HCH transport system substrate-binding protein